MAGVGRIVDGRFQRTNEPLSGRATYEVMAACWPEINRTKSSSRHDAPGKHRATVPAPAHTGQHSPVVVLRRTLRVWSTWHHGLSHASSIRWMNSLRRSALPRSAGPDAK